MADVEAPIRAARPQNRGKIAELPRRQFLEVSAGNAALSQMRFVSFETNRFRAFGRLITWFRLIFSFTIATAIAGLLGRDTPERRARRLRRLFEQNGGAFVRLGIHLSTRVDFLPWVYCNELSCMVDRMDPFPMQEAIAAIERSTGRPLAAVFTTVDPQPILSTSVACSYQAVLRSGEKVIVKVRRPGIGEAFMADVQAFDWLMDLAEFLTIFRPGFTRGIRSDLKELLLQELDFVLEARQQDAFRRAAVKSRRKFFSAPRVHLGLCGEEVVISEFASGLWLWELLGALEQGNENVLTRAREMNIQPKKVAKRLLWVSAWSWEENLFFHSDPQPNNVIVGQDSTLYFINFTNTGTLSRPKRQAMRQMLHYARQRDPQNMARACLVLMEPLPPMDLIVLTQELESYNWQLMYALEATPESLAWEERTSAVMWVGIIRLARKYRIHMDLQVLRLLRSTLLIESMAAKLHPRLDYIKQYWKFNRYRAEQARRRVTNTILETLDGKTNEQLIIRLDRIAQSVEGLIFRTRHMLTLPTANFNALMSKWSFALLTLVRFLAYAISVTGLAVLLVYAKTANQHIPPSGFVDILRSIFTNPIYQVILIVLVFVNGRTVLFRMDDEEV